MVPAGVRRPGETLINALYSQGSCPWDRKLRNRAPPFIFAESGWYMDICNVIFVISFLMFEIVYKEKNTQLGCLVVVKAGRGDGGWEPQ